MTDKTGCQPPRSLPDPGLGASAGRGYGGRAVGATDEPPQAPISARRSTTINGETVKVLCDLIIPADERSVSATQAGVPEFIDDWMDFRKQQDGNDDLRAQILGGLAWLDHESSRLFQKEFCRRGSGSAETDSRSHRVAGARRGRRSPWVAFFISFGI